MGKLGLTMQTKPILRGLRASSVIKLSFVRLFNSLRMKLELKPKLLNKLASQSGRQQLFLVKESKALLDGSNRSQRQLQADISDARAAVNNMQTINGRDMTSKRQLESSIHTMQAEVDGMLVSAKNAEEKAKKAMVDAARLADELRAEQDHATNLAGAK